MPKHELIWSKLILAIALIASLERLKNLKITDIHGLLCHIYTYSVNNLKFGPIELTESSDDLVITSAGFFIDANKEIKGLAFSLGYSKESLNLLEYLKLKYNEPTILAHIPKKNNEGQLLGRASYLWNNTNQKHPIILILNYEYLYGHKNISSDLYIIDKDIKVNNPDDNRTVLQYLIDVYKE